MAKTVTWPLTIPPPAGTIGSGAPVAGTTGRLSRPLRARADLPRRGLDVPVGVTKKGRSRTVTGDANDRKIIYTALGGNDNRNAFQQENGIGDDAIFDINDELLQGRLRQRLIDLFDGFERQNRYKLAVDDIPAFVSDPETQELTMTFQYFNLESDEPISFSRVFTRES